MKFQTLLLIFFTTICFSQNQIKGLILDKNTNLPLPFATVVTNTGYGVVADSKGKFFIKQNQSFTTITITYVGYKSATITIDTKPTFLTIKLEPFVENLDEIIITGTENPAIALIKKTIDNKANNNIETALKTFKFNTYNKVLITANPDSISSKIDSIFVIKNGKPQFLSVDSTNYNFKKEIENKHLYLSEKISQFAFEQGKGKKEIILASRMAGLKQPIYELFAITLQDFSFYGEFYTLAGTKYVGPLAKNALKHYSYKILDTVSTSNGNAILVYFNPKSEKTSLEGVLYLNAKTYAITHALAEIKAGVYIKAVQQFSFEKDCECWFPLQMEVTMQKGNNSKNVKLFGRAIQIAEEKKLDSIQKTTLSQPSDFIYFSSKTVNSNIEINIPLNIKNKASNIEFADDSNKKNEAFWDTFRSDSLTNRGKQTYVFLDSVAQKEGVEKKINLGRNILKGYYPTKYVNLNLGKTITLNNYEGLRVGLGGETNTNFSPTLKIESYVAYGTKDEDFKYSFGLSTRLNKDKNSWMGINYTNDLKEAASLDFIASNTSFSPVNPRNLNISKFYNYKTIDGYFTYDIKANIETKLQISTGDFTPVFNYQFISPTQTLSQFKLSTASLAIQYNPKSSYINSPIGKLTLENKYPQFTFQLTKSFKNLWQSQFNFTQLNISTLQKFKTLAGATTTWLFQGGIVLGDAPITHLYNSTPNYTYKNPYIKRINFAGKNSFETMGYNEFISDKFIALHFKHDLIPFNKNGKFKPQLSLISRAAFGDIKNANYHNGLIFKNLRKGYFESGFELNRLFKGFGLSAHYRYGPYQNLEWYNNLAVKLTFKLNLGIGF